jgi:hypothetical protein
MGSAISSTRARLEVAEALLRGELSPEEARVRRAELLKRSRRGRLLLRIEKAGAKLEALPPWEPIDVLPQDRPQRRWVYR